MPFPMNGSGAVPCAAPTFPPMGGVKSDHGFDGKVLAESGRLPAPLGMSVVETFGAKLAAR
jgi:hypothetical protein